MTATVSVSPSPSASTPEFPPFCVIGEWDPFTPCSVTCGGGNMTRIRDVSVDNSTAPPGASVDDCPSQLDVLECNTQVCDDFAGIEDQDGVTLESCEASNAFIAVRCGLTLVLSSLAHVDVVLTLPPFQLSPQR